MPLNRLCTLLGLLQVHLCTLTCIFVVVKSQTELPSIPVLSDPKLSGQHFRITVVEEGGLLEIKEEDDGDGSLSFSGYLIDILRELAKPDRADFSYELLTPSGFGSLCQQRLDLNNSNNETALPYDIRYRGEYLCAESDVNDRPLHQYSTDLYWGSFYITPNRLKVNQFTVPFTPPNRATLGMFGTATHVTSIPDLAASNPNGYRVCAFDGTAYRKNLMTSFPQLNIQSIDQSLDTRQLHALLDDGTCHIIIQPYPFIQQRVYEFFKLGKCTANNGKPIGAIGQPLEYGLNHWAFGIRNDLNSTVASTLNFWMQALMACFPEDTNGVCPDGQGSFSRLYYDGTGDGATGDECGYVQFPSTKEQGLPVGVIVALCVVPVVLVLVVGMIYHLRLIKEQERRMKKRFIQQLARNIDIGPNAGQISAQKLTDTFMHIGGKDGLISKADLAKWMNDLHLDFLSERDFDRLWDAMDMDGTGYVDPIEFCTFLNECEKQFHEVSKEISGLPKSEKFKIAARRLTNIEAMGEEEVLKLERKNNRRSRLMPPGLINSTNVTASAPFTD
jgi:hypothetical protein